MCFLYSPVIMEVVCSVKASKHKRCLNNKVFHIFQIKSPKVIHLYIFKQERIGGIMTILNGSLEIPR